MKRFGIVTIAFLCFVPSLCGQVLRAQVGQVILPGVSPGKESPAIQPAAVKPSRETIVYPVRSGSASELAETLTGIYPDAHIAAVVESNVLLIHVDANLRGEIVGTLTQLDRPRRVIEVQAYLLRSHGAPLAPDETAGFSGPRDEVLRRIEALRKSDQLSIENRIELTTIENQKAMVQFGQLLPIVTGTTITANRIRANNYQNTQTGTILSVEARVTPDDAIVMEINFDKSEVDPQVAPTDENSSPPPASISKLTHQTTLQFASGEAVLAGTMVGKPDTGLAHSYLVVTASVRDGAAKQATVAGGPASESDPAARSNPTSRSNPVGAPRAAPSERATRPAVGGSAPGSAERFPGSAERFPSFAGSAERFEVFLQSSFSRADRDGDGVLSEQEQASVAGGQFRDDFKKYEEVSFDVYKRVMTARLQGVGRSGATQVERQPDRGEARQPAGDPRKLEYFK